ncbi:MAG: M24 family metallopeptidase [Spirochaetales bacterium]|nr:M24 family metallopeptidase [Spirochaetales bacterium]
MSHMVTAGESGERIAAFEDLMNRKHRDWEMAFILGKVNQFYFAGTMQDGLLVLRRGEEPVLWVRRSLERARDESPLTRIEPMGSYRQAASYYHIRPERIYLEKEIVPLAMTERLARHFSFSETVGIDRELLKLRSVKSEREREILARAGEKHRELLNDRVPPLLQEGMDEMEFTCRLYEQMIDLGYQGISRISMFQTEMLLGQIGFGENSCYPSYFNGPGGNRGLNPAAPLLGDRSRRLAPGDMVFADIGFGLEGYHSDHTMTYLYRGELPQRARDYHDYCVELRDKLAARLRPGEIPSQIYSETMDEIQAKGPKGFGECFMGHPGNQVKFLGHGVGLHIDEFPVIAQGFNEPLEENMVIALEPKCALPGVGTVGVEDTYTVTSEGGSCLTGGEPGMMRID